METDLVSLLELYTPIFMLECGNRSHLDCRNIAIRPLKHTQQSQSQLYHLVIHLHHDFMETSFIYIIYIKCGQYCNVHTYTSITMKQEHAYITQHRITTITYYRILIARFMQTLICPYLNLIHRLRLFSKV